jgi:hypothetical protein
VIFYLEERQVIECSECNDEISNNAEVCPNCGHPQFEWGRISAASASIFIGMALLWYLPSFSYKQFILGVITFAIYKGIRMIRK